MLDPKQLQDPFSDLWKRLCEARRKAYDRVRGSESADYLYLSILQEERKVFDAFVLEQPRD